MTGRCKFIYALLMFLSSKPFTFRVNPEKSNHISTIFLQNMRFLFYYSPSPYSWFNKIIRLVCLSFGDALNPDKLDAGSLLLQLECLYYVFIVLSSGVVLLGLSFPDKPDKVHISLFFEFGGCRILVLPFYLIFYFL